MLVPGSLALQGNLEVTPGLAKQTVAIRKAAEKSWTVPGTTPEQPDLTQEHLGWAPPNPQ
jgi:hypothetical protein